MNISNLDENLKNKFILSSISIDDIKPHFQPLEECRDETYSPQPKCPYCRKIDIRWIKKYSKSPFCIIFTYATSGHELFCLWCRKQFRFGLPLRYNNEYFPENMFKVSEADMITCEIF